MRRQFHAPERIRLIERKTARVRGFHPADTISFGVTDEGCDNLRLYIGTRNKTWYVDYREANGKKAHRKLGLADALTVAQAREMAKCVAVKVAKGERVKKEKPAEKKTLGAFLENTYFPFSAPAT
ncbi:MAG: Arm DNA-binding domain-containing protein [Synergistaceae bacterium]|nr:Arm DNA-binding domain-containing protein [Synergistaceae bacterium]